MALAGSTGRSAAPGGAPGITGSGMAFLSLIVVLNPKLWALIDADRRRVKMPSALAGRDLHAREMPGWSAVVSLGVIPKI